MEKKYLLKELADLKSVVKNYEISLKSKACEEKMVKSFGCQSSLINNEQLIVRNHSKSLHHNHKNMVFINPKKKKANAPHYLENVSQHVSTASKQTMANNIKVYVNPNFKKCLPSNDLDKRVTSSKTLSSPRKEFSTSNITFKNSVSAIKKELISETHRKQMNDAPKQICSDLKNNCKIFINPNYNKMSIMNSKIKIPSPERIDLNVNTGGIIKLHSDIITNTPVTDIQPIPKICVQSKNSKAITNKRNSLLTKSKTIKDIPMESKMEKKHENSNSIFLNPMFKGKIQLTTKEFSTNGAGLKYIPVHITQNYDKRKSTEKELSKESCSSISLLGSSNRCLKEVELVKQVDTSKCVSQRKRSCSTSLAADTSKLIRKRKASICSESNVKGKTNCNEPVFLSKTKLIHTSTSKSLKNKLLERAKVKRVLPKTQLKLLTPDEVNRKRKQSLVNSIRNLIDVVPNCGSVTKIQSKNGKSLRLLRKRDESQNSMTDLSNKKGLNTPLNQKSTLKYQLRKNALCVVQKLRKSQFSKINAEQEKKKTTYIHNTSKYVYRRKDFVPKETVTNSALNIKQIIHTTNKPKRCNYLSEKHKFIGSKYRYIRKQSFKSSPNKNFRCKKEFKNTNLHSVTNSKSIRKYKLENSKSKTNHIRKKLSIVNIDGIFYRCSRTSLTRNKTPKKVSQDTKKQSQDLLLNIRGQKFHLENNGRILRCIDSTATRKRIDIGGMTFIATSCGSSLIRTNYHTARSIIVQAKQKSLSQLTKRLKKNNESCPFYHRLGRCIGKDLGSCVRQHDPKYIAVCKKFIQGLCEDSQCLLSHKISCHNMPTCQHFLAGHCGRDHCPYPHIKVSDNAPICLEFLRGFCVQGDQCAKRHFEICPSFEKGMCPRGKYCPYPHPKSKSDLQLRGKFKRLERKVPIERAPEAVSSISLRYFEDVNLQKEKDTPQNENLEEPKECPSEGEQVYPMKKRPKLGRLPSFIPL